jgi:murein DD-endopeptidase MepM/ murein hydrolase activator NlpD
MRSTAKRRNIAALTFVAFCAGMGAGWWLHAGPPTPAIRFEEPRPVADDPVVGVTSSALADVEPPPASPVATMGAGPISVLETLRGRDLRLPLDGVDLETFKHSFAEQRGSGRTHEAADMLAPRNTPVRAVDDGTIAKLFLSRAGGITIYQFDPSQRFTYYYAHLERYADGLTEGQPVKRGELIGYVGTSGNAPPDTPHLHFAIFELTADRRWWQGTPIDPYRVFHD